VNISKLKDDIFEKIKKISKEKYYDFFLWYLNLIGFSIKELANEFGIKYETLKKRIQRFKKYLVPSSIQLSYNIKNSKGEKNGKKKKT
jgi:transposase